MHTISDGDVAFERGRVLHIVLHSPRLSICVLLTHLLATSASDSSMRTFKLCSVVFGLYPSTDKNDVQVCCHKQDSRTFALRHPSVSYTNAAAGV